MLAMLTEMKLVHHSHCHFGMPGSIQKHTLVYTDVLGLSLTMIFDLTRIAALGIFFDLVMDIAVNRGILRYLRHEVGARLVFLGVAIIHDPIVLADFIWVKIYSKPMVVGLAGAAGAAGAAMLAILIMETYCCDIALSCQKATTTDEDKHILCSTANCPRCFSVHEWAKMKALG